MISLALFPNYRQVVTVSKKILCLCDINLYVLIIIIIIIIGQIITFDSTYLCLAPSLGENPTWDCKIWPKN